MATHRFETVLEAEGPGVFFQVPLDVPAVFGKARAPVRGTINGHPFRSTVAVTAAAPTCPSTGPCARPPGSRPATPW
jgi:Domain of unknown function (DUF1905)